MDTRLGEQLLGDKINMDPAFQNYVGYDPILKWLLKLILIMLSNGYIEGKRGKQACNLLPCIFG